MKAARSGPSLLERADRSKQRPSGSRDCSMVCVSAPGRYSSLARMTRSTFPMSGVGPRPQRPVWHLTPAASYKSTTPDPIDNSSTFVTSYPLCDNASYRPSVDGARVSPSPGFRSYRIGRCTGPTDAAAGVRPELEQALCPTECGAIADSLWTSLWLSLLTVFAGGSE